MRHARRLVARELAGLDAGAVVRPGAALVVSGAIGMMVKEEDHLRIQSLHSGFGIPGA